ncbi:MAG: hypothetical protein MJ252_08770 [archaeon]|nr:hypothetical protein [archaeon]
MFLANSLREKLKRSYLENDPDAFDKPKYAYNTPPSNPKVLINFRPPEALDPENKMTTQQLQALDNKQWQEKFSLGNLRKEWKTRKDLQFDLQHKKFPGEILTTEVKESQIFVKNLIDPDILELRQKLWNKSSDTHSKDRPELKQTLFEVSHGLKDFKVVPLKEKIVEEGVDSRNNIIVNGNAWDISNRVEQKELRDKNQSDKEKANENSIKYWRDNEYNRENGEPLPVSEERKKVEIIRYFKKYRNPRQQTKDEYKTMQKVKDLTNLEKQEIEKQVRYKNPGTKYQEKIDALVFKEMYNSYRYKYNELTGKLDKEEMKKKQMEENKFRWKDDDLVNKIVAIDKMKDLSWFKPNYLNNSRLCKSSEKIKRELLKPLVIMGNDIHLEEELIKKKMEEDYKLQKKKEILLSQKMFSKKKESKGAESRYPLTKEGLKELEMSMKNYKENNKTDGNLTKSLPLINTLGNLNFDENSGECSPFFLNAYQKVCTDVIDDKNRKYRKYKDQITFEYSHPGTFREFEFEETKGDNENNQNPKAPKKKIIQKLWSCCLNSDENSKGCQRKAIKKFQWIYDP